MGEIILRASEIPYDLAEFFEEIPSEKSDVFTVASQPYPGSHFATFPPQLVEPCALAGTSPKACEHCRAPWKRIIESTGYINAREAAHTPNNTPTKTDSTGWMPT